MEDQNIRLFGKDIYLHKELRHKNWDMKILKEVCIADGYHVNKIQEQDIKLVFDIGAHIGFFALSARQKWPNAKIICFEPCATNFQLLSKNIKNINDTIVINSAMSNFDGSSKFLTYEEINSRNTGGSRLDANRGDIINVMSINTAIRRFGCPDFMKLDCEGAEKEILISAKNYDLLKTIRHINGESHYRDNSWLRNVFTSTHSVEIQQGRRLAIFSARLV